MLRRFALIAALVATALVAAFATPFASIQAGAGPTPPLPPPPPASPTGIASIACANEDVVVTFSNWTSVIDIWYAPGVTSVMGSPAMVQPYLRTPVGASGALTVDLATSGTWSIFVGDGNMIVIDSQPITCTAALGAAYNDGRLNNWEGFSPVAIYASSAGPRFFAIDANGSGVYAFTLNPADLPAFGGSTQQVDSFTAQGLSVNLYWLETGELQVNVGPAPDGKTYVYIFDAATLKLNSFYSF